MPNTYIWLPDEKFVWIPAQLLKTSSKPGGRLTVKLQDGKEKKVDGPLEKYETVDGNALFEECENLVDLESFNEGIILHHAKERFARGTIYTFVGQILVAVNPYRKLDIYDDDFMHTLWDKTRANIQCPPHVFSTGATALHNLRSTGADQAVLISGESGAGKTETTKKILQFISTIASAEEGRHTAFKSPDEGPSIEDQILESNPILESFGNAKTLKNNNSSRFGKYMEILFNKGTKKIVGSQIHTYLLEKTRVISQAKDERNYHIFYMLLAGASKEVKKDFRITSDTTVWKYLCMSGCDRISGRKEKEEYAQLITSFENLGFDGPHIKQVLQVLSGILHLGNLEFEETTGSDGEGSKIKDSKQVELIAHLLELKDTAKLEECLCFQELVVGKDRTLKKLKVSQASDQRDAMAKFIYGALYESLVDQINTSLAQAQGKDGKASSTPDRSELGSIGILDIFGFEVFVLNSFEQLCINYCNERLQTYFNTVIFQDEIGIYKSEKIDLSDIQYKDNLGCVKIIDGLKGAGVFSMLDEECIVPQGSDQKLLSKMNQAFSKKEFRTFSEYYGAGKKERSASCFVIKHFAGEVIYDITDFKEKNMDTLSAPLMEQIHNSDLEVLKHAISVMGGSSTNTTPAHGASASAGGAKGKSHKTTVSKKFKESLDDLMGSLSTKQATFVRCLKPNESQKPDKFDCPLLLNQMKYSGLFEAIQIRKAGYAVRMSIVSFCNRYQLLIPQKDWKTYGLKTEEENSKSKEKRRASKFGSDSASPHSHDRMHYLRKQAHAILAALGDTTGVGGHILGESSSSVFASGQPGPESKEQRKARRKSVAAGDSTAPSTEMRDGVKMWAVGETRVFLRSPRVKTILDGTLQTHVLPRMVIRIQTMVRGFLSNKMRSTMAHAARKIMEEQKQKREGEKGLMGIEDTLSTILEQSYREAQKKVLRMAKDKREKQKKDEEKALVKKNMSIIKIQGIVRAIIGRKRFYTYGCEKAFHTALEARSEPLLRAAIQKKQAMKHKIANTPALQSFEKAAKILILDLLSESYISKQLEEAMSCDSNLMLKEAIANAEEAHMSYLPIVRKARKKLEKHEEVRRGLLWLEKELRNATSVPRLLASVDYIQRLVREASFRGLQDEDSCMEALYRISKVRRLLIIRDKIRYGVETCCVSAMQNGMKEREEFVPIFGNDLLQQEVTAVEQMTRMLNLLPILAAGLVLETADTENTNTNAEADDSIPVPANEGTRAGAGEGAKDVLLPAWARALYLTMKSHSTSDTFHVTNKHSLSSSTDTFFKESKESEGFMEAKAQLDRMVGSPDSEAAYRRLFKWTVAFCSWMPDHPCHDSEKHPFGSALGSKNKERRNNKGTVDKDTGESEAKGQSEEDSQFDDSDNANANTGVEALTDSMDNLSVGDATNGASISTRRRPKSAPATHDKYGRNLSKLQSVPSYLAARGGGPGHAWAPPKTVKVRARSPEKVIDTATGRKSRYGISSAKDGPVKQGYTNSTGPYSQRRAKSALTADLALKRGKKLMIEVGTKANTVVNKGGVNLNRADVFLESSIKEYDDFHNKNQGIAHWT